MTQRPSRADWINAYLEWANSETGISEQLFAVSCTEADDGADEDIAAVYLEWLDAEPAAGQPAAAESLREAVLLMALRTESECMHLLRQALDDGQPTSQTLQLAMEALDCAKNLLNDERRAWRALSDLRSDQVRGTRIAWDNGARMDWPGALEDVESDVRALAGRILELRAH